MNTKKYESKLMKKTRLVKKFAKTPQDAKDILYLCGWESEQDIEKELVKNYDIFVDIIEAIGNGKYIGLEYKGKEYILTKNIKC